MEDVTLRGIAEAIEQTCAVADPDAVLAAIRPKLPEGDRAKASVETFASTDEVLLLVDHVFPGWSITISGVASEKDGHWTCVLRSSAARDNDPFVGIGKCGTLPLAVLAAFLKALAFTD